MYASFYLHILSLLAFYARIFPAVVLAPGFVCMISKGGLTQRSLLKLPFRKQLSWTECGYCVRSVGPATLVSNLFLPTLLF